MTLAAQLMLVPLALFLPMAWRWGARSALIRLTAMLLVTWYGVSVWQAAAPATRSRVTGWAVLAVLALLVVRSPRRGGRGRGVPVGRGGSGAVVLRQGGGRVIGPRPFNAGGPPTVVVVADRVGRAGRGVGRRALRGQRRLEVVGGTAVRNVREGRAPWYRRPALGYLRVGAWLERQPWLRNQRQAEVLRDEVDGQPGLAGSWAPGEPPSAGWLADLERWRREQDRRGGG